MAYEGSFGLWLRQRRKSLDISLKELALCTKYAQVTIEKIEGGTRYPTRKFAERLVGCLLIPPEETNAFVAWAIEQRAARGSQQGVLPGRPYLAGSLHGLFNTYYSNVPAKPNRFVGRSRETRTLGSRLKEQGVRLLTLTGPGGIGKTRLSLELAVDLASHFANGVLFVPLEALTNPEMVASAVAEELKLAETTVHPLEKVKEALRSKHMLLIFDNFEQVLSARSQISEILAAAPQVKILVTSREVLQIYGEQEFAVPPLTLPSACEPITNNGQNEEGYEDYGSVVLFVERARAVSFNFTLTEANAPVVADICRTLDGLPLAIELAAAQVKRFTPEQIAPLLESAIEFLTDGPQDAASRQRTIRATVKWSYDLLRGEEKDLFNRMSVFADGGTLDAIMSVCDLQSPELIDSLVRKNLVYIQQGESADQCRFLMLNTIKAYALEQLELHGEKEALCRRHADYYAAMAETAEEYLRGPEQVLWLHRLKAETSNMEAALRWWDEDKGEGGRRGHLQMAANLSWFWMLSSRYKEGGMWLEAALARYTDAEAAGGGLDLYMAKALYGAGVIAQESARYSQAKQYFQRSLRIYEAQGSSYSGTASARSYEKVAAQVLASEALSYWKMEEVQAAFESLGRSLELCRAAGYLWGEGLALTYKAIILDETEHKHVEARLIAERGLEVFEAVGDRWGQGLALACIGNTWFRTGKFSEAAQFYERGLNLFEELDARGSSCWMYTSLGHTSLALGDYERASMLYERGLPMNLEFGHPLNVGHTLLAQGEVARFDGDHSRAEELYTQSLPYLQEINAMSGVAWYYHNMGILRYLNASYEASLLFYREGLQRFLDLNHSIGTAACLSGIAAVSAGEGNLEKSAKLFGAAQGLLQATSTVLSPVDEAEYRRIEGSISACAEPNEWEAAWNVGYNMSLTEAVEHALGYEINASGS